MKNAKHNLTNAVPGSFLSNIPVSGQTFENKFKRYLLFFTLELTMNGLVIPIWLRAYTGL